MKGHVFEGLKLILQILKTCLQRSDSINIAMTAANEKCEAYDEA